MTVITGGTALQARGGGGGEEGSARRHLQRRIGTSKLQPSGRFACAEPLGASEWNCPPAVENSAVKTSSSDLRECRKLLV